MRMQRRRKSLSVICRRFSTCVRVIKALSTPACPRLSSFPKRLSLRLLPIFWMVLALMLFSFFFPSLRCVPMVNDQEGFEMKGSG